MGEFLRRLEVVNRWSDVLVRTTWGVPPAGDDHRGSAFWPDEVREEVFSADDPDALGLRLIDLAAEISWKVIA